MSEKTEIKSAKIYIKEVFSKWFRIPEYQRPYVWGKDQINDLLVDIGYAAINNPDSDYFLGSFVYQHKPSSQNRKYEENDLLDGQQRLTTLFLLIAVARDITSDPNLKNNCQKYIFQKEDEYENTPEIIRIKFEIREDVELFVSEYIKQEDGTLRIEDLRRTAESKKDIDLSIRNIAKALIQVNEYFTNNPSISIENFFKFLLKRVMMVYVSSEDLEDAFRLFTILNDRGVKLRNSDILKAQNLRAVVDESKRNGWARFWEELESDYQEDFDRFMSWIRTILVKEKARLSLLKEFEENIYNPKSPKLPLLNKGEETFKLIATYHDHYFKLFDGNNRDFCNSWAFDNLLNIMETSLPSSDWVPPLLTFYNKFKEKDILLFLGKLDNKFSSDWISQYTPTDRIENMNKVIKQIDKSNSVEELFNSDVFNIDYVSTFRNIEGSIYGRQFAKYILLKLDYLYLDEQVGKMIIPDQISVEHILPQKPPVGSQWVNDFTNEAQNEVKDKLGNLILLGKRKNSSQGNLDFNKKKEKYFAEKINIFPNSIRIMKKYDRWSLEEFKENQTTVVNKIRDWYSKHDQSLVTI